MRKERGKKGHRQEDFMSVENAVIKSTQIDQIL